MSPLFGTSPLGLPQRATSRKKKEAHFPLVVAPVKSGNDRQRRAAEEMGVAYSVPRAGPRDASGT